MYDEGPEFGAGGNVTHQKETRFEDPDKLPEEAEKTLSNLRTELSVDEEYQEAFEIARRLLNFYWDGIERIAKSQYYAAAALYFGLRSKNAPYLLIEISKLVKDNCERTVGRCYLKLYQFLYEEQHGGELDDSKKKKKSEKARRLHLVFLNENFDKLKQLDASIYIRKFIRKCWDGDREKKILLEETSIKLLKRMTYDWMAVGRRPQSLCGAAILIAASYHGENISSQFLATKLCISCDTLKRRLDEFRKTQFSQLTLEQFEQLVDVELVEASDPPIFTKHKKLQQLEQEEIRLPLQNEPASVIEENLSSIESSLEEHILDENQRARKIVSWEKAYSTYQQDQELKRQKQKGKQNKNPKKIKVKREKQKKYATPQESVLNEHPGSNPEVVNRLFEKPDYLVDLLAQFK